MGRCQRCTRHYKQKRFGQDKAHRHRLIMVAAGGCSETIKFQQSVGENNLVDLFTKYFDEATINRHTEALAHKFTLGRASEAPTFHMLPSLVYNPNEDVLALSEAMNCNNSLSNYSRRKILASGLCKKVVVESQGMKELRLTE